MATTLKGPAEKRPNFPIRKRTGTAAFHLSKEAVDFGQEDLERLTEYDAVMFFADALWGSTSEMPCPHCGTIDTHYWSVRVLRWKCKLCGKRFSVTSKTILAGHKLPLVKILKIAYSWANGSSGVPALQLRRDWNLSYPTIYVLLQKFREGLLRGHNTGILCGVQEVDGLDLHGRRYREKRNVPQGGGAAGKPSLPTELVQPPEGYEFVGPPLPPKWGKTAKQPEDRRLLMVMRTRGKSQGKGAADTRVGVAQSESSETARLLLQKFASSESAVVSDEDPAYAGFGKLFAEHKSISHSKSFSDGKGANNNQAESFNRRMRRGDEGIYLAASNKYLLDYAAEQTWREDSRRMSTGDKFKHLFCTVLPVGESLWWRGYTHGNHRQTEILLEGPKAARGRGRPKGSKPRAPR
jgi:transposase-like protein